MKLKKLVTTLGMVTMMFSVTACNNALNLNINLQKGEKYNTHMVSEQQTTFTVNNQENKTNQTTDMNLIMDVKDVDKDKNSTINFTYDSLKVSIDSAGQKIE